MMRSRFPLDHRAPSSSSEAVMPGTPSLWFDGTNIDGSNNATLSDGDPVTTWHDQGSQGKDAVSVRVHPVFREDCFAGNPGIQCAGVEELLNVQNIVGVPQPWIFGSVWRALSVTPNAYIYINTYYEQVTASGMLWTGLALSATLGTDAHMCTHMQDGVNVYGTLDRVAASAPLAGGSTGLNMRLLDNTTGPGQASFIGYLCEVVLLPVTAGVSAESLNDYFEKKYKVSFPYTP